MAAPNDSEALETRATSFTEEAMDDSNKDIQHVSRSQCRPRGSQSDAERLHLLLAAGGLPERDAAR